MGKILQLYTPDSGQYVQNFNIPGNNYIWPDNVTWTASDSGVALTQGGGNRTRLTASAVHNMTEANSEGSYLYLISGGTGWTAGTSHQIAPSTGYISTTVVDIDTKYTAGMGVPVFAKAGTTEATSEIPLQNITLPALRDNTEFVVEATLEYSPDASTGARRGKFYLESTEFTNQNTTGANTISVPYRFGFRNQNNASAQRAIASIGSTGYAAAGAATGGAFSTGTSATGTAGKVCTIRCMPNVVGITARVSAYDILIRG